ncbi:hypothetical protein KBC04_03665 [Candidatus Babeliales bacterium]|nr:hypothetical protein [Candidatus Babeliales bacterium]MBP9843850.1 hypothetical protein [Candidatus Babeliales bacterium]
MKRVKIGVGIIIGIVGVYFIISYGIFYVRKPSLDVQLQPLDEQVVIQKIARVQQENDNKDDLEHDAQYHELQKDHTSFKKDDEIKLVIMKEKSKPLPVIMPESEEEFVVKIDRAVDEKILGLDFFSFVTMPIPDDYEIDVETQNSLDILIGNDFNRFINLVLQSNNDVVSKEACRSCGLYAFFKKVKHHKTLTIDDITTLQHIIGNLYRFAETMRKLSKDAVMSPEQYTALQDLNRPQVLKNSMKLQARRAAAASALKKIQSMSNR